MRAAEGHNNAADRTDAVSSHTRAEGKDKRRECDKPIHGLQLRRTSMHSNHAIQLANPPR
jgi:hypothetical protein